jgi:hypothetical protein
LSRQILDNDEVTTDASLAEKQLDLGWRWTHVVLWVVAVNGGEMPFGFKILISFSFQTINAFQIPFEPWCC